MENYIDEALVTASNEFHGYKVPQAQFHYVLNEVIRNLQALDRIKKALYYGREVGQLEPSLNIWEGDVFRNCNNIIDNLAEKCNGDYDVAERILHAIIGKATEAGELLELLKSTLLADKPFDFVNAAEEIGDGFWYDALLAYACGTTFDDIQRTNIAKLRARFPNKFNEHDANNRNLQEERDILEVGSGRRQKVSS